MRTVAIAAALGLAFVGNALAAGPQLSPVQGGSGVTSRDGTTRYLVVDAGGARSLVEAVQTHGGRVTSSYVLNGSWGVPLITLGGETGGLSRDGQLLVLANREPPGPRTAFVLMYTHPLAPEQIVSLTGNFAFDALSPDAGTLYLIQHGVGDPTQYRVRAYDLRRNRLLPYVIADKRQAGWTMTGYPVARATSSDGRWIYTLYRNDGGYPFVHALDSVHRSAVCIGLPWPARQSQNDLAGAVLRLRGTKLAISAKSARFVLDTQTFAITREQRRGSGIVVPGTAAAAFVFLALTGVALRRRLRTDR